MELEALQEILPEIQATGTSLLAISPMLSKYAPQLVNKLGLTFPVLSDPGCKVMAAWGILFTLPPAMIEVYQGFGIDLQRFQGDDSWQLPLPGRIIIDQQGIVRNVELSTDHSDRPEPTDTLQVLQAL